MNSFDDVKADLSPQQKETLMEIGFNYYFKTRKNTKEGVEPQ